MYVIKNSFNLISKPLLHVINLSLTKGVFPDKLKIAKLIPIFKTDDPQCFNNYTPITKFFEVFLKKSCHDSRLIEFVERFEILHHYQFGFRKKHSTSLALVHLTNKIASAIDRKELTAGVFLDLSKAFDTLDHKILFNKLEHYGICGMALQWIKSYLSNRKQFVQFRKTCSDEQVIKCGVPQGSVLGPLLFILNINVSQMFQKLLNLYFLPMTPVCFIHTLMLSSYFLS